MADAGKSADVAGNEVSLFDCSADHVLGNVELDSGLFVAVSDSLTHTNNLSARWRLRLGRGALAPYGVVVHYRERCGVRVAFAYRAGLA